MTISDRILKTIKKIALDRNIHEDDVTYNQIAVEQAIELNNLFELRKVNSKFTEYEKQVSINCIELIAQNKDKYILDEGVLYLVELVEKYTIVPINQP